MPLNRNALIRYKTIDKCLQNRYRRWTLEDLIDECSEALYEYEGIKKGISKRSIQLDIQIMRTDKLGYNAPIVVYDNKYYTYEDADYSITNIPLTDKDLRKMSEAVEFMKQFKGFSHFKELGGMLQKLEDHVYSHKEHQKPVIDFEKNENLKGLEHLDVLYQSIKQQRAILLTYQSFRARKASSFFIHPYLLKEYRNRWFIIGAKNAQEPLLNLALDRILDINPANISFIGRANFDAKQYFRDVIGVTINPNHKPEKVVLFVTHKHAQYVITKPLHHSQKVIEKDSYGITIELEVQHNFELEKEILGFGDGILVIAPQRLKRNINERLTNTVDLYNTSISKKTILTVQKKITHKGYAVVNFLYTKRSLNQIGSTLNKAGIIDQEECLGKTIDLTLLPTLKPHLMNRNLEKITNQISKNIKLKEVVFHQCLNDELFEWKQANSKDEFNLIFFLNRADIPSSPIQLLPGSHKKKLNQQDQKLIIENSVPTELSLSIGGAIFIHTLLLHRFSDQLKNNRMKFFILRFGY